MRSARPVRTVAFVVIAMVLQWIQLGSPAGGALAQGSILEQARTAMAEGNPQAAYDLLKPLEQERAGEPAFDYLLGIAAMDVGRDTEAVFALERVLAVEPGNALARAEIGRAYMKLGEREAARRELEAVRDRADVPEDAKAAIERYLTAFRDSAEDAFSWRAFIAFTLGYDSNVNSATADDTVDVLGLSFELVPTDQQRPDWFGVMSAGASFVQPLSADSALIAGLVGTDRINQDERRFDRANIDGYLGISVRHQEWNYTGALQYGSFRLDRDPFRNVLGMTVQARRALDNVSEFTGFGQVSRIIYPNQKVRNAWRYVAGAGYSRALGGERSPLLFAGAFLAYEDESQDGVSYIGHKGAGLNIGGDIGVFDTARAYIQGRVERRIYGGREPFFARKRHDTRWSMDVGLTYELLKDWVVTPNITLVHNDSNISINEYDRAIFLVTLRRNFGN